MSQLRAKRQLAPHRARVDLRRRAGHRARPAGSRVPRRAGVSRRAARLRLAALGIDPRARSSSSSPSRARCRPRRCATTSTATARPGRWSSSPSRRCSTVCLFPGPLLAGASGLLFGTALGTPVSIVVGDARRRRSPSRSRAGGRTTRSRSWRARASARCARGSAAAASSSVLYARIAPGVPYSLVNYAAGLTPVTLVAFTAATAIGCAPRAFAYTALGGSLDDLTSPEAIVAVVVLVLMALGGLLLARRDAAHRATSAAPEVSLLEAPSKRRS